MRQDGDRDSRPRQRCYNHSVHFNDLRQSAAFIPMTDSAQSGTRGRLPAWMLILCGVMLIAVAATLVGLPRYRQHQAVRYIESVGGLIGNERVGPEWLRSIVGDKAMHPFATVSIINLIGAAIDDVGLIHLSGFTNLKVLWLDETSITDAGLVHLHRLTSLKTLSLEGTSVTDAGVDSLQAVLPSCKIVH